MLQETIHATNRIKDLLSSIPKESASNADDAIFAERLIGQCAIAEQLTRAAVQEFREEIIFKLADPAAAILQIREMFRSAVSAFSSVVTRVDQLKAAGFAVGRRDDLAAVVRKVQAAHKDFEEMVQDCEDPQRSRKIREAIQHAIKHAGQGVDWRQEIFGKDA